MYNGTVNARIIIIVIYSNSKEFNTNGTSGQMRERGVVRKINKRGEVDALIGQDAVCAT